MKTKQPGLNFDPPIAACLDVGALSELDAIVLQIARDQWTLKHDPSPAPNRQFYEERIASFTAYAKELRRG